MTERKQADEEALLAGIRVIDAGTWVAGPAAATVMSDFGAEVIKLESFAGDPLRQLGEGPNAAPCDHNYFWVLDGRNKRSLAIDLKHAESRPIVDALVASADVLITNFRPALAARLGIDWPRLSSLNSRLVYAQVTGYGESGPEADQPGYDTTAWWSRSGLADWVRRPGGPPATSAPGMGDHATAMTLFGAIMTALWARERSGRGRRVTTSLFANGIWSHGMLASMRLCGADMPERTAETAVANALATQYETADERWLQLTLLNEDREWPRLVKALEAPHLGEDPRFATLAARRENAPALHLLLSELFLGLTARDVRGRLDAADIPAAMLTTLDDLTEDRQALAADVLTPVAEPRPGWEHTISSPLWIDGAGKRAPGYAARLGEHSDEILEELGFDDATRARLSGEGVIRSG